MKIRPHTRIPRGALSESLWGILDQAMSSLCNILGVLCLARCLDGTQFGIFTLGYSLFSLLLGFVRSYFGIPINLADIHRRHHVFTHHLAATAAVTTAGALLIPIACWLVSNGAVDSHGLIALGALCLATPLLVCQDLHRIFMMATSRVRRAFVSDTARALLLVPLMFLAGRLGIRWAVLLWLFSALISLMLISYGSGARPAFEDFRENFRRSPGGVREAAGFSTSLSAGLTFLLGSAVTIFTGPATLGALRGSSMLFGPMNTLIGFLDAGVLGRMRSGQRTKNRKIMLTSGGALTATCISGTAILLFLPQTAGRFLLGNTWDASRAIVPVMAIEYLFLSWTAALMLQLKVNRGGRALLYTRLAYSAALICLSLGAASLWRTGMAVQAAYTIAGGCGLLITAFAYARSSRREMIDTEILQTQPPAALTKP